MNKAILLFSLLLFSGVAGSENVKQNFSPQQVFLLKNFGVPATIHENEWRYELSTSIKTFKFCSTGFHLLHKTTITDDSMNLNKSATCMPPCKSSTININSVDLAQKAIKQLQHEN
jgi:hypothetical protein